MSAQQVGLGLKVTPSARVALRKVLDQHPPGSAVRIFVLPGADPHPSMAVERPRPHVTVLDIEGLPFLVDELSRRYLAEAVVDHLETGEQQGFHIEGPNVPSAAAASAPSPPASTRATGGVRPAAKGELELLLQKAFKQIFDPEIPMNIWDLGLIYGMDWPSEGRLHVRMTMTSPGSPVGELLRYQVQAAARAVPGVKLVDVDIVWEPPWSSE